MNESCTGMAGSEVDHAKQGDSAPGLINIPRTFPFDHHAKCHETR
jgi:hypothetical protein